MDLSNGFYCILLPLFFCDVVLLHLHDCNSLNVCDMWFMLPLIHKYALWQIFLHCEATTASQNYSCMQVSHSKTYRSFYLHLGTIFKCTSVLWRFVCCCLAALMSFCGMLITATTAQGSWPLHLMASVERTVLLSLLRVLDTALCFCRWKTAILCWLKPSVLVSPHRFRVSQFNQHKVKMDKQLLGPHKLHI